MSMLCPSRTFTTFDDLKTGSMSPRIAAYLHIEEFFGRRIATKPATDAPFYSAGVTARMLDQREIQLLELASRR